MKAQREKFFLFEGLILFFTLTFFIVACQKAGETGSRKKPGTGRNDVVTQGKVISEDLFQKNKEVFKTCLNAQSDDLLTEEGFATNTLTGKNLESILSRLTNQKNLKSALIELEKSHKDIHENIKNRLNLFKDIMTLQKDLPAKEKFLLAEGISEALFSSQDKVLDQAEVSVEAKKLEEPKLFFSDSARITDELMEIVNALKDEKAGKNAVHESQKRLDEKIKELSNQQAQKLENKIGKVKSIAARIDQKDKKLKEDYENLSKELVVLSGVLEKKACTQMVIEKSEKNGNILGVYLQALKSRIDLESVNGSKSEKGR